MPTRSKRHATTVRSAPWPALDLGSSLLTLAVAVTIALGTSSPRPERTPLDRPLLLSSVHRVCSRSPIDSSSSNKTATPRWPNTCVLFDWRTSSGPV